MKQILLVLSALGMTGCLPDLEPSDHLKDLPAPCIGEGCNVDETPPTTPSVIILPNSPSESDALNCLVTLPSSTNSGSSVKYTVAWKRNGSLVDQEIATTLGNSQTSGGETWSCEVTAHLSANEDIASDPGVASVDVAYNNQAPGGHVASVYPATPSSTDNLLCVLEAAATDAEGSPITYAYEWIVDGNTAADQTTPLLQSQSTTEDDNWICRVTAFDSQGNSSPEVESDPVTVQGTL